MTATDYTSWRQVLYQELHQRMNFQWRISQYRGRAIEQFWRQKLVRWQADQQTKDGNTSTDYSNSDSNLRNAEANRPPQIVLVALGSFLVALG